MGGVKSLATIYSDRSYLLYYIDRKDHESINKILSKRSDLLNAKLTENTKMTPLVRTAYNGDVQTAKLLLQYWKVELNQPTENGQTALIVAVKRNHLKLVRMLLEMGADWRISTPYGLIAIEFAILAGNYQMALLLIERGKTEIRTAEEYEVLGEEYHYRYVDYKIFLECLNLRVNPENVPNYLKKPRKILKDPVIDPRQTWKQWAKRQLQFKDPPLIERDQLPLQLQPQNRKLGKLSTFMSSVAMSPLHQKPNYHPRSKSEVADSQNQIKMGQQTSEEIEVRTIS